MMFPVQVQQVDGRWRAVLSGAPAVVGTGGTTAEAVDALRAEVAARVGMGEMIWADLPALADPPGRPEFTDAARETADEIIAEVYRERDAQKAAEFPE